LSNRSDEDVHFRQYPSILDELGYFQISFKAEQILHNASKNSIALLGEKGSKDLLDHICYISGFSEAELLRIMTYLKSHYTKYSEREQK